MTLKRMSLTVSEELYDFISAEAEKDGLSMNAVIIFALNTYRTQKIVLPSIDMMKDLLQKFEEFEKRGQ